MVHNKKEYMNTKHMQQDASIPRQNAKHIRAHKYVEFARNGMHLCFLVRSLQHNVTGNCACCEQYFILFNTVHKMFRK